MSPKISVILPVYNCQPFLEEAVLSILNQDFTDFELIIIDDGSNDKSREIIRNFAKKDNRIIMKHHKKNKGLIATLNEGLQLAKSKIIARMDGDDVAYMDRFSKQYQFLKSNPEIVVVGSWVEVINDQNKISNLWRLPVSVQLLKWRNLLKCPLLHPTVMFRKKEILALGGYDNSAIYFEDHHLWSRVMQKHAIANIPEYLLQYRIHNNSISKKYTRLQKEGVCHLLVKNINRYCDLTLDDVVLLKQAPTFTNYTQRRKIINEIYDSFVSQEILTNEQKKEIKKSLQGYSFSNHFVTALRNSLKDRSLS